jgi:hypothetical protein
MAGRPDDDWAEIDLDGFEPALRAGGLEDEAVGSSQPHPLGVLSVHAIITEE